MMLNYLTAREVAARLGCSDNSVGRAARAKSVGVYAGGKLVAIAPEDVETIAAAIHDTPGNPNWIAASQPAPGRGRRRQERA